MAGRHKKILAQLKRIEDDKEAAALAKMDSNQRWDYYCRKNAAKHDPRELLPIVIDGVEFTYDTGERGSHVKYPLGRSYPSETHIPDDFNDQRKYKVEYDAAMKIFFNGGALEDLGLKRKAGIPARTMMQTLNFLLTDFSPSAERKWKTVAWFLHHTCDRITENETA